jgi:hypothetical protein
MLISVDCVFCKTVPLTSQNLALQGAAAAVTLEREMTTNKFDRGVPDGGAGVAALSSDP